VRVSDSSAYAKPSNEGIAQVDISQMPPTCVMQATKASESRDVPYSERVNEPRHDDVDTALAGLDVDPRDLRVDIVRPRGRECAVRVTHLPTGTQVEAADQPTLEANRRRALERLRAALER
jgi:hypothetical protein